MAKTKKKKVKKSKLKQVKNKCCDPYKIHKKWNTNNLRTISAVYIEKARELNIILDTKSLICTSCCTKIGRGRKLHNSNSPRVSSRRESEENIAQHIETEQPIELSDFSSPEQQSSQKSSGSSIYEECEINKKKIVDTLNKAFKDTPIHEIDYNNLNRKRYSTDMLKKIIGFLSATVFKNAECDSDEMISQLKEKFGHISSRNDKIKILSLLPKSWSAIKIANEFRVPLYMARQVKGLVERYGILCNTEKKMGSKRINDTAVELVEGFYRSDEISRMCPGLRDFVTVTDQNGKTAKQRRLILMNLREAYVLFKEQNQDVKIGFSKFAELRPRECILALENYGTHTVCVCQYHQNFKLCFSALKQMGIYGEFETFRHLLNAVLCDKNEDGCRFGRCMDCFNRVVDTSIMVRNRLEDEMLLEIVSFKQWTNASGKIGIECIRYSSKYVN